MTQQVCSGASLMCSFGSTPSNFAVLPKNRVATGNMPAATILDHVPYQNVMPFGMCSAPSNHQVAAATAAAGGVLTPQPCKPATGAPWTPGSPGVKIANQPALNMACTLSCTWGGVVSVNSPGQSTVNIP